MPTPNHSPNHHRPNKHRALGPLHATTPPTDRTPTPFGALLYHASPSPSVTPLPPILPFPSSYASYSSYSNVGPGAGAASAALLGVYDYVCWMGDLNWRWVIIRGDVYATHRHVSHTTNSQSTYIQHTHHHTTGSTARGAWWTRCCGGQGTRSSRPGTSWASPCARGERSRCVRHWVYGVYICV